MIEMLEMYSTSAFAPLAPPALGEPADRRGAGFPLRPALDSPRWPKIDTATTNNPSSAGANEASHFARMTADLSRRIQLLKVEARFDDVPFSEASYRDFLAFIRDVQPQSRPSLFLNDNGNLRALWRNREREQIGLQFLGDDSIQFVIFKNRPGFEAMVRVAGVDRKANILGHIKASGALGLFSV